RALEEDIGHGDITTDNLIAEDQEARGIFLAKSTGTLAGIEVCRAVFAYLDPHTEFTIYKQDGSLIVPGDNLAEVKGKARVLLTGERVALNFLQRLSGIASRTRQMVNMVRDNHVQIVDTRKTTPGLRTLEKYAVTQGGGRNHRFGLYDGVMIKDNHIKAAGGITPAVSQIRNKIPHTIKIEVEVEYLEQLQEALNAGADIIMLDNMDIETMKEAVALVNGQALLEASGGINETTLTEVAQTGVDFISIGALTHSITSLDISFNII
ncbi:MAG TPA: carboxylating nicotinate-nucleotide diphosphorylase, partial [Syntrophomonadaceae bacterium]|nr:carboxylating nicotinate-nucleotide diphosphorylase [Syntrophomonadaceae bacterium]